MRIAIIMSLPLTVYALGPSKLPVTTLVSFGSSTTDQLFATLAGAKAWPVLASEIAHFSIIDVAIAGATCNSSQVDRPGSVMGVQIPLYLVRSAGNLLVDLESTVYSIWIGANDVSGNEDT